jgi:hypothetical protein
LSELIYEGEGEVEWGRVEGECRVDEVVVDRLRAL